LHLHPRKDYELQASIEIIALPADLPWHTGTKGDSQCTALARISYQVDYMSD